MPRKYNLAGNVFGSLRVVEVAGADHRGEIWWHCACNCGVEKNVSGYRLRSGKTQSCGCLQRAMTSERSRTHGASKTRLYYIWSSMVGRTTNPENGSYQDYGARGIRVCSDWRSFAGFSSWAQSSGYDDRLTIDRVNNDGNYEPSNCRWADRTAQARNRRANKLTADAVRAIRKDTRSNRVIADEMSLSASYVWAIKNQRAWKEMS